MTYRFKRGDSSVEEGLRRIAVDQIDSAIAEIDDEDLDRHEVVHQVRKRCKKVRGLIRLVRPAFGDYAAENAAFRDAAQALSYLRDSEALLETHDLLMETYGDQVDREALASVRRRLTERQKEIEAEHDLEGELQTFRDRMTEARERAERWRVAEDGFGPIAGGLRKTYKRAQRAMAVARERPSTESFHEWRKRVKYHWYHTRLLRPIWPGPMKAREQAADRMGDLLGDHHDLAVLERRLDQGRADFGPSTDLDAFGALVRRRKEMARRWARYWQAWRAEQPAREAALAEA